MGIFYDLLMRMIERNRELFDKGLSYDDLIRKMGMAIPTRLSVKLRESIRDGAGPFGAENTEAGDGLMELLSTSCVAQREAQGEESKVDGNYAMVQKM